MKPVCAITVERLAEYLAGELDERAAAEMRSHLEGCAPCRAEEAELAPVLGMLARDARADGGVKDPGPRYWNAFAGRVRTRRAMSAVPAKRAWVPRLAWAAALVVVVAIAVGAPTWIAPQGDDELEELLTSEDVSLDELDPEELAQVEKKLLEKRPKPTPTPTPAAKKKAADEEPTGGNVYDELVDLDDLTDEELEDLLKRIEAIRT